MIFNINDRNKEIEIGSQGGKGKLNLDLFIKDSEKIKNVKTFAMATLEPGASVGLHKHFGECEIYYILSGIAEYNDDGNVVMMNEGDLSVTYDGQGHGIKNVGNIPLKFIALIVLT